MVYDPEKSAWTILTTSLLWGGFSASFTATRSFGYELVSRENQLENDPLNRPFGWYQEERERLNPQELSLAYHKTISANEGGKVVFESSVNTGLTFDLQRYTYSRFFFTLSLGAKINRFLDISVRSHSENSVVYRYFQYTPLFSGSGVTVPGERNILADLFNSFRFDDVRKREASGFKFKSVGIDLVHHLGDWDATLTVNMAPELDRNAQPPRYRLFNQIGFLVQWKPIKEFKTDMKYDTKEGFRYE